MQAPPPCSYKVLLHLVFAVLLLLIALSTAEGQSVQPRYLRFGDVGEGYSKTLAVNLTNSGRAPLEIKNISSSQPWFSINGIQLPYSLPSGQSVPLNITFFAQGRQHIDASILVTTSISGSPLEIPVHGTGIFHAWLSANPVSLVFANVPVGTKVSKLFTVINAGTNHVTVSQVAVNGDGFTLSGVNLPVLLLPQNSLTFTVTFAPTSSGNVTGNTVLAYGQSHTSIALSGSTASSGQLAAAPSPLVFGNVAIGKSQSARATLTASGSDVTVTAASLNSAEFAVSGLTLPATITAGQSKSYTVTFTPQSSGNSVGDISFTGNASNSASQSLMGSGTTAPTHSVSLTWSDSSGSVAGYNVYRGSQSGGPYTKITPALDPTANYVDGSVQGGQTYFYAATSVGTDGTESPYSSATKAVIPSP